MGFRSDRGLGAIGDAEARRLEHGEIVGPVADRQYLVRRKAEPRRNLTQGLQLGGGAEDRIGDFSRQLAVRAEETVGAILVRPEQLGDGAGELLEAAGHDRRIAATGAHRAHQNARAGRQGDARRQHFIDDALGQTGEQRDPFAQRRLEGDVAAHRPLGDRGDIGADAGETGEFVDAFLTDHRRVHIGDEQPLGARRSGLGDDVDALGCGQGHQSGGRGAFALVKEVGGDAGSQPAAADEAGQHLRGAGDRGIAEGRLAGIGDERDDKGGWLHGLYNGRLDKRVLIRALLIAGPTASGKSAVALALAKRFGGVVVNADSMQVYRDLRTLTARPSEAEEREAPHRLFGEIDGEENFSVGRWLAAAKTILWENEERRGPILFVGGTGLYFRALTQGLSDIPHVPDAVRAAVRAAAEGEPTAILHARLAESDPLTAARLRPSDRQRILRALEVLAATARPLAAFQGARQAPALASGTWAGLFLAPEREALNAGIDARFTAMLRAGALDEVAALMRRGLDPALPVMRAHGAPHLMAHLKGELPLAEAIEMGQRDTRQYAKRQFTWARHQMPDFAWVAPEAAEEAGTMALASTCGSCPQS
jgi:tRNA dimethylallyltransferase